MYLAQFEIRTVVPQGPGCFVGVFVDGVPPINKMGSVIGYANRAQVSAGRTRFEIVTTGTDQCDFRTKGNAVETPSDTLFEHLIHFLVEVGFMPESLRPKPDTPAKEHPTFSPSAQAAA